MAATKLLGRTDHRPWALPSGPWRYYQEWNDALFLHYKVPAELLRPLIPPQLELDTFNSEAWVSLVAFKMQKIRPRHLPAVRFISDFYEVNLRTYVVKDNKPGVLFLNIEGGKPLSVFLSRNLSGLPYEKAKINRHRSDSLHRYHARNSRKGFFLDCSFSVYDAHAQTAIDKWLVERYCLYLPGKQRLFRFDIHHLPWELQSIDIKKLALKYDVGDMKLPETMPDRAAYSRGVKVLAWGRCNC